MLSTKQKEIKKRDKTETTTKQNPNKHTEKAKQNHKNRFSFHDGCLISFHVPQTLSFAKSALPTASQILTFISNTACLLQLKHVP